ncbi:MAG: hypothetical protein WC360_04785 [Opitutales bacterium]|jgi:hypothetical protein
MARRRKNARYTRLWLPPLLSLALAAFVQHACQMLSASLVPGLWLHVDALFLLFPLLYLRFKHGLPQVVLTALALDAMSMGPFGTRLVLYSLVLALALPFRVRIRRENPLHTLWVAMGVNLFVFAGLELVALFWSVHMAGVPAERVLVDFLISELVVGLSAFWWVELQRQLIIWISAEDPASFPILN